MKRIYTIALTTLGLLAIQRTNAQCTVVATASPAAICLGDSSLLSAAVTIPGTYYTFDFNSGTLPPGWSVVGGATFDTLPACAAPTLDNSAFYWSSTATFAPIITTADLDVSAGGTINYEFRFAGNSGIGPCETADQYNEGVVLEYSTDGGTSWGLIVYHCSVPAGGPWDFVGGYPQTLLTVPAGAAPGNGNGSTGIYDVWAPYVIPIPAAAQTPSTRFRWRQPNSSGSCCDNWGLDNINVAALPSLLYNWSNSFGGYGANSQYITDLYTDTCLIVTVTDTALGISCQDTVCVTVDSLPALFLAYSNPFCVGELVTFDGSASDPIINSYQWDLDNNGSFEVMSSSPVYPATGSFTTAGNYTIHFKGVTPGGCNATIDTVVHVYNNPTIAANVLDPTVCPYNLANFTASAFMFNPPGQTSTIANYSWDLDFDGLPDTTGTGITAVSNFFPTLGAHPVVLTVTSNMGCQTTDTVVVTIVGVAPGNIVAPTVCGNSPANFSFNSTGTPAGASYVWNFGDPGTTADVSTNPTPTYLYPGAGFYPITLIVGTADGCLDTLQSTISISPLPAGSITNTAVCTGVDEIFNFNHTSSDSLVSYNWTFPGGSPGSSTNESQTVNFATPGGINVTVQITNQYGCSATIAAPFIVRQSPYVDFGAYPICISRFTFDGLTFPNDETVTLDWYLGDGTEILGNDTSLFNHIYTGPGDYNVTLVVTDQYGCIDSTTESVHVDDSLFIAMPNVLVQSSSIGNNIVNMDELSSGFNLCIDYTYTIFDRWGVQVFQTHNNPYDPDLSCGTCFAGKAQNGAPLVPGVYYYVMEGNFNILKSGSITIFE